RYAMLGDRTEEAVSTGREALRLAEELGLDDIRAKVLINIGSARGNAGEIGGEADVQQGIQLAMEINFVPETIRGLNNLAAQYVIYGDPLRGAEVISEARTLSERYGHFGFLRFIEGGPEISGPYNSGEWDVAIQRADKFLRDVEAGSPHYQAASAYAGRAVIRIARDDEQGARNDAERAAELAPQVGDGQLLLTSLPM